MRRKRVRARKAAAQRESEGRPPRQGTRGRASSKLQATTGPRAPSLVDQIVVAHLKAHTLDLRTEITDFRDFSRARCDFGDFPRSEIAGEITDLADFSDFA